MAAFSIANVSPTALALFAVVLLVVRRLFWEMTVGARRRRLIREHGCEPMYRYPHKGIGGKLLGLDTMKEVISSAKEGRMNEANRLRNWQDGRTNLRIQSLRKESKLPILPCVRL
jgi:hypothetical protein